MAHGYDLAKAAVEKGMEILAVLRQLNARRAEEIQSASQQRLTKPLMATPASQRVQAAEGGRDEATLGVPRPRSSFSQLVTAMEQNNADLFA